MKKGIGVLFVFLFFVSSIYFVLAADDCRCDGASETYFIVDKGEAWWEGNLMCTDKPSSSCINGSFRYYTIAGACTPHHIICRENLTVAPVCGNNVVESGEQCDGGVSCNSNCTLKVVIEEPVISPGTPIFCSPDQTIVSLFRENNSHVSDYSDENYPVKICYSNLLGYNYTGTNPHECSVGNGNVIFWVNSTKNSHIAFEESAEYSIPICYGNLVCSNKTECDPINEVLLLKAYDVENSHVSLDQPEYTQSICCRNSLSLTGSFWSDLSGQEITSATLGDTVLMVAKGFEFQGKELSYTLMTSSNTPLGSAITKAWHAITFRGWSLENWVQTGVNEWVTDKVGTFRFRVNIVGTNFTSVSFTDLVVGPENSGINEKPFVNITSNRSVYTLVGANVSFNGTVYDKEDFLTVVWDYSDAKTDTIPHYSLATTDKAYIEATHSFNNSGHYVVRLTATEEQPQRGQTNYDSVDVFALTEGINVIPIVSSPIDKKNDYGNLIRFIASESYVANCSFTAFRTGYNITVNGTSLNCVYIHAPNQQTVGAGYSLDVAWLIDGVMIERGAWGSLVPTGKIQNFLRYFLEADTHTAQLSLRYTSN